MTLREKVLYHQIHPIKLLTDWATAVVAAFLLWQHALFAGIVVGLLPSVIASALLIRWGDLERLKQSAFGRYMNRFMTRRIEMVRMLGMIVVCAGAWYHSPLVMCLGLASIILAWAHGKLWSRGYVGE